MPVLSFGERVLEDLRFSREHGDYVGEEQLRRASGEYGEDRGTAEAWPTVRARAGDDVFTSILQLK